MFTSHASCLNMSIKNLHEMNTKYQWRDPGDRGYITVRLCARIKSSTNINSLIFSPIDIFDTHSPWPSSCAKISVKSILSYLTYGIVLFPYKYVCNKQRLLENTTCCG